ncbi:Small-conductance mechanosensitive channel [Halioglobus japonicus]|nr:Small-conductance mechanosensitive channel [Halioglobus japonicus]
MHILLRIGVFGWLTLAAALVHSQDTDTKISDPEPVIETLQDSAMLDEKIRSRIENIFAEIDVLNGVTISVAEGVVTLGGDVANEAAAQKAQRLAIRLVGVVTVEDEMNRTLAVSDNVQPLIEKFAATVSDFFKALPLIGLAILMLVLSGLFGAFLARRKSLWQRVAPNPFLADLLSQAVRLGVLLLGVILALEILGAGALIATILGGAGVLGLAIGFAVRDSMENYISSIMLSLRQPFRAKDHVIINEHEGIVVRLTSRATILMTLDGNHLRIPNSTVFKGIILNYTTNPERRLAFELGVDAQDDPVAAMSTGLDAIRELEFVLSEPEPSAIIKTVGDSNIVILFTAWVDQRETDYGKARSHAIRAAMRVLEDQGFTLPEPIYRVRFDPELNAALGSKTAAAPKGGLSPTSSAPTHSKRPVATTAPEDDVMDTAPETHLVEKVEAEIESDSADDLLDQSKPRE